MFTNKQTNSKYLPTVINLSDSGFPSLSNFTLKIISSGISWFGLAWVYLEIYKNPATPIPDTIINYNKKFTIKIKFNFILLASFTDSAIYKKLVKQLYVKTNLFVNP